MRLVKHFWIPRPIMIYGQRYWHFLKLTIALIFYTVFKKSSLILLSKSRAIAVAPQPYLVLAGNNKGYQNTIKDAFINAIGIPVEFHSILKGTVDEADALRQVQMYTDSAASVHETEKEPMAETADSDYRLVEKSEIPDDEKDMPALAKAFRILSDCDIYEKK